MKARLADTYNVIEEGQKCAQKLQEAIAITEEDDIEIHYNVIFKPVSQLPVVSLRKKDCKVFWRWQALGWIGFIRASKTLAHR